MLESLLRFLADSWVVWLALGYLAFAACALALCRAAKLADEALDRNPEPASIRRERSQGSGLGSRPALRRRHARLRSVEAPLAGSRHA